MGIYSQIGASSATSGNMVLIQSQTASNSASINFTTGISGYTNYLLVSSGVVVSNNDVNLSINFSTDGGGSYDTTAVYNNAGYISIIGTGLIQQGAAGGTACNIISVLGSATAAAANNAVTYLFNLNSASLYKTALTDYSGQSNTFGYVTGQIGCTYANATVVNAFKILASAGTITTGTFKLYGIVN